MVVSTLVQNYLSSEQCTIENFAVRAGVSTSAVKKWLYLKQPPSRRMLGKLRALPGFFPTSDSPQNTRINQIKEEITLAKLLARQSETYKVRRLGTGKVKVELTLDEELLYEPVNLNVDYKVTEAALEKRHYILTDEDIAKMK